MDSTGAKRELPSTDNLVVPRAVLFNAEIDVGNSGLAATVDWSAGQNHRITLTDSPTLTFTAPAGVGTFKLKVIQDATGSRTITWPASVLWTGKAAPTLSTAASSIDLIAFYFDGTNYFGAMLPDFG